MIRSFIELMSKSQNHKTERMYLSVYFKSLRLEHFSVLDPIITDITRSRETRSDSNSFFLPRKYTHRHSHKMGQIKLGVLQMPLPLNSSFVQFICLINI